MEALSDNMNEAELTLWNRKKLNLRGIEDVISFDELNVYLVTKNGNLMLEGTELHITTLDVSAGKMTVEGYIRSMIYNEKESATKSGFFSKMFK